MNDRQQWRADGLATAATIVLHELEHDGVVQEHSRSLLAAALAAYVAGKAEQPTTTPEDAARQAQNAMRIVRQLHGLIAGPGEEQTKP